MTRYLDENSGKQIVIETNKKFTAVDSLLSNIVHEQTTQNANIGLKANQSDLLVERERINTFTTLGEGSTTGDAELIDARIGADGTTYANAGGAIRNQFDKINNDFVSHKEDYATQAEFPITNLVSNSDFSNGTTEWESAPLTGLTAENNELIMAVNDSLSTGTRVYNNVNIPINVNDKLYYRFEFKPNYLNTFRLTFDNSNFITMTPPIVDIYNIYSGVYTMLATTINGKIMFNYYHASGTDKTYRFKNVLVINLTETFGIGKEPTTLEMDNILAKFPNSWFNGTFNLKTLREIYADYTSLKEDYTSLKEDYTRHKIAYVEQGVDIDKLNNVVLKLEQPTMLNDNIILDASQSNNFVIDILDNQPKAIKFIAQQQMSQIQTISVALKYNMPTTINYPFNLKWQNGKEPIFYIGDLYMLLFQSFDDGVTWLGACVGSWSINRNIAFDDFNRIDNATTLGVANTGQAWQYSPISCVWGINNNQALLQQGRTDGIVAYDIAYLETGVANCRISCKFTNLKNTNRIAVRIKDNSNYIMVGRTTSGVGIYTFINNVQETLFNIPIFKNDKEYTLSVILNGDNIKMYIDNVYIGQALTQHCITETRHGIISLGDLNRSYDDFKVEVL